MNDGKYTGRDLTPEAISELQIAIDEITDGRGEHQENSGTEDSEESPGKRPTLISIFYENGKPVWMKSWRVFCAIKRKGSVAR